MKTEEEILIEALRCIIDYGKNESMKREEDHKELLKKCEKKRKFLDSFYENHKKEFDENGFEYNEKYNDWTEHPLFGPYNSLNCEIAHSKQFGDQKYKQYKIYFIFEKWTTGSLTISSLASASGLTKFTVKNILKKLCENKIISTQELDGKDYYWFK